MERKRLGFKAIAVLAGTDVDGKIKAQVMQDKAIQKNDVIRFMFYLRREYDARSWIYLFLDNLPLHHTYVVKRVAF